ncbi:MAG: hypothetical protein DWQ34_20040 [Planctomycetota bacterium]|nr:MAG: hypothetical protein DWQ29_19850 [Planctomycetota bacterium]REJ89335.1 MAG: hypothetical protein DWQ34_20040 [Planctomycetota bacterium]REK30346.1 MAG: hypothetical protein DWQ41_02315 [Planctomycetota bacterium]REK31505.1 MAG: hypothetical protein DWQ45_19450 [Planctomycetota bacterium]
MKNLQLSAAVLLSVTGIVLFSVLRSPSATQADDQVRPIPTEETQDAEQSIRPYMHAKLVHSQGVLHGLVLEDFSRIALAADSLRVTSRLSPEFVSDDVLDDEVYKHFQLEFLRLSTRLGELARDENLEGAAFTYNSLTANCMACHQYLREKDAAETTDNQTADPQNSRR